MLRLENITYSIYKNNTEIKILDGVSFEFELGKNYCITGANGCGKSTLAKIIMGILKQSSGKIYFNNQEISNLDITQRAKLGLAFSMQQPVRFKGLTPKDLLEYASDNKLHTSTACEYLSKVGLCARVYLDRQLDNTLSGGELKRVEIASVLARQSTVNIFDEPEAGIDIWSFNSLVDIFKNSVNKNNLNIIISHQEKLFENADELLVIDNGKIAICGKPAKILKNLNNFKTCKKLEGV